MCTMYLSFLNPGTLWTVPDMQKFSINWTKWTQRRWESRRIEFFHGSSWASAAQPIFGLGIHPWQSHMGCNENDSRWSWPQLKKIEVLFGKSVFFVLQAFGKKYPVFAEFQLGHQAPKSTTQPKETHFERRRRERRKRRFVRGSLRGGGDKRCDFKSGDDGQFCETHWRSWNQSRSQEGKKHEKVHQSLVC